MKVKKMALLILALISVFAFIFTGCDETYTPAAEPPNPSGGSDSDVTDDPDAFTVRIYDTYKEQFYVPGDSEILRAFWNDGSSIFSADFGEDGVARISGLDGDYRVTVTGYSSNYAYDTNAYEATNESRNVIIDLLRITRTTGKGSDVSTGISLSSTGIYQTTINSETDKVFYTFTPKSGGSFSITSWVDATADMTNPVLEEWNTPFYPQLKNTIDDGGVEGIFTKNFKYVVQQTADMVGNPYSFAIRATSKTGNFPVTVVFALFYDGEYSGAETIKNVVVPQEDFEEKNRNNPEGKAPDGVGTLTVVGTELNIGKVILDQRLVGLNETDGYYHLLDENGNPEGELLYAYITTASPMYGTALNCVEDPGNHALSIFYDGYADDYKLFIEGYSSVVAKGYQQYEDYQNVKGYADYANSDGLYPVTPELKNFLQEFAKSQVLFMDGNGWIEYYFSNPTYDSYENSMWLFDCAYYKQ